MEKLLEALKEKAGITTMEGLSEEQIIKVAKSLKIDPMDYIPRSPARVVTYTNKRDVTNQFVETDPLVVGRKADGMCETVRGLFFRKEALDQVIADLVALRESMGDE